MGLYGPPSVISRSISSQWRIIKFVSVYALVYNDTLCYGRAGCCYRHFFYLFMITSLKFVKYYLLLTFSTTNNNSLQEAGMYDQYIIFSLKCRAFIYIYFVSM